MIDKADQELKEFIMTCKNTPTSKRSESGRGSKC